MDEYDSTASTKPVAEYSKHLARPAKMRVAYLEDCFEKEGLDPEIKTRLTSILDQLKKTVIPWSRFVFLSRLSRPAYYVLTTAEASSNLARYDGIRYGYRSKNATDLESTYKKSRSEGFGAEVKRRIMLGTFCLSARLLRCVLFQSPESPSFVAR